MMENDEANIKEDKLQKISQILNVDINELKNFDDKKMFNSYFQDNSINQGNVLFIENENLKREKEHFEKQQELYLTLIKEKDLRISTLESLLELKSAKNKK